MGRAAAFIAVAILTVFLILRFVSPVLLNREQGIGNRRQGTEEKRRRGEGEINSKPTPNTSTLASPQATQNSTTQRPNDPTTQHPIEPPRSAERRTYEQTEAQRMQFYQALRASFQYILVARPAPDDQAVLEIYMTVSDPYASSDIVQKVITPDASRNGFEKVRFFQPNQEGGAERYRLDAEATVDRQGVWTTFRH